MKDWLLAGAVYVPMCILGSVLSQYFDPYFTGWLVGCTAVLLRWRVPGLRVRVSDERRRGQ